jgi:hypothetical protein
MRRSLHRRRGAALSRASRNEAAQWNPTRLEQFVGAMLLTAYLRGATAAQVRIDADLFPIVFPALLGALLWDGLYLREERVRALMAARGRVTC